jgi:hypothetical protein
MRRVSMPYHRWEFLEKGEDDGRKLSEIPNEDCSSPEADGSLNQKGIQFLGKF